VNGGRCIRRALRLRERVRWVSVREERCRRQGRRVRGVVREGRRDDQDRDMCREE